MPKYNNYNPDDSGALIQYGSSDFRSPVGWGSSDSQGLNTYHKVGHGFYWVTPIAPENGEDKVVIRGDKIICNWKNPNPNGYEYRTTMPLENSSLLFKFINLFNGYTNYESSWVKEDIIDFTEEYGTLVAQPETTTIDNDNFVSEYKDYDSVKRFIEHQQLVKETYELFKSGKDVKKMRANLNLMMKEITLGVYPMKITGKAKFIHDDPEYTDEERKMATPKLPKDKEGRPQGMFKSKESEETIVGYRVPSLRACITLHLFDVISGYLNINQCTNCLRPFISMKKSRQNQDNFCCKKCGNYYRTKKNREKARSQAVKRIKEGYLDTIKWTPEDEKKAIEEQAIKNKAYAKYRSSREYQKRERELKGNL